MGIGYLVPGIAGVPLLVLRVLGCALSLWSNPMPAASFFRVRKGRVAAAGRRMARDEWSYLWVGCRLEEPGYGAMKKR